MKFQVISLFPLAIAAVVKGEMAKPLATLELADEGIVEYFDDGDAILIVGNGMEDTDQLELFSTEVEEMGPVAAFEKLSGKAAPAELVEAQTRVDKAIDENATSKTTLLPPGEEESLNLRGAEDEDEGGDRRLVSCLWFYSRTGNASFSRNCNGLGGRIEPYRGCLGVAIDHWTGSYWSTQVTKSACAGGWAYAYSYGAYGGRRARTYSAYGDGYHLKLCID